MRTQYIYSKYYCKEKNLLHITEFMMWIKYAPLHPFSNN